MPVAIVEQYFDMIQHLDTQSKQQLIAKIQQSISEKSTPKQPCFGAWDDEKNADDIIADIKESSSLQRNLENFA